MSEYPQVEMRPAFEHCNLCGCRLSSMMTRNIAGEFYFCPDCYDGLILPFVEFYITSLIRKYGGDANKTARETQFARLRPVSEFGGQVQSVTARFVPTGTETGRFTSDKHISANPREQERTSEDVARRQDPDSFPTSIGGPDMDEDRELSKEE